MSTFEIKYNNKNKIENTQLRICAKLKLSTKKTINKIKSLIFSTVGTPNSPEQEIRGICRISKPRNSGIMFLYSPKRNFLRFFCVCRVCILANFAHFFRNCVKFCIQKLVFETQNLIIGP